jgi:hypothetical protein
MPFVVATPITLLWTIFCIFCPLIKTDFISQFAYLPMATYDSGFYDGLGYNPNTTTIHPFAKPFMPDNSLFKHTYIFVILLIVLGGKSNAKIISKLII